MSQAKSTKVSKRQAQAVLTAVKSKWKAYCLDFPQADGKPDYDAPMSAMVAADASELPQLMMTWQGREDSEPCPAIVWESGPFEWAYGALGESWDYELAAAREEFPGLNPVVRGVSEPKGVHCEPYFSYVLCIYPA
jgi:hypothetical protein